MKKNSLLEISNFFPVSEYQHRNQHEISRGIDIYNGTYHEQSLGGHITIAFIYVITILF